MTENANAEAIILMRFRKNTIPSTHSDVRIKKTMNKVKEYNKYMST